MGHGAYFSLLIGAGIGSWVRIQPRQVGLGCIRKIREGNSKQCSSVISASILASLDGL